MAEFTIPLIVRGEVIEDDLCSFTARRGEITFKTPDVARHVDKIVLSDANGLADLYTVTVDEIVDYLVELGRRLSPDHNPHVARALEVSVLTSGLSRALLHRMYASMGSGLTREFLTEQIEQNIGVEHLEQWNQRRLNDRDVWVRAFGTRTVHLNAGNGPAVATYALINGSILRCDNIVKSPSNDPFTAAAIALTMIDMAPDHPVTRHMTVAYWKGGNETFERQLYTPTAIEKIVAWGGAASMKHIRRHLQPGLDLIALDPKVSASIIGAEVLSNDAAMSEAAERLARDVGYFNQEGCLSSRLAYLVADPEDGAALERVNEFGRRVEAAIRRLPATISTPHPAFDPTLRAEIDGLRFSDDVRIFGCRANEGGVLVSQSSHAVDFSDRLMGRVVNIIPVATPEAAAAKVTIHTQTIGIYPAALKKQVRDACLLRGAQRLTDLGCATFEGMAAPHDGLELMRRMVRWGVMEDFEEHVIDQGAGLIHSGGDVAA
ncbi:MAG: acyl-CoA reductase [Steroidobacteraceae bacterium]